MSALIVLATKPFITSVTIPLEGHMRDLHTGKRLWLENGGMTWVFYHTRLHSLKAGAKHWKAYIWAPWVNPKPVLLPNRWQPWYRILCLSLPFCQPGTLRSIISTNTTATRMTNDCFFPSRTFADPILPLPSAIKSLLAPSLSLLQVILPVTDSIDQVFNPSNCCYFCCWS